MGVGIILLVIGTAVATALLVVGWRGRRVDDHPVCRRCGFDLFGLPPESSRCSECGADVTLKRATRRGHRRKRRKLLAVGMAVLLPVLIFAGLIAWPRVKNIRPIEYKPVWWLMSDLDSSSTTTADSALDELLRRYGLGKLSTEQTNKMVQRLIGISSAPTGLQQANQLAAIVRLRQDEKITPEQWDHFWRQLVSVKLTVRRQVHPDDLLPIRIEMTTPGLKPPTTAKFGIMLSVESVKVGDRAAQFPRSLHLFPKDPIVMGGDLLLPVDTHFGPQTARCVVEAEVYQMISVRPSGWAAPATILPRIDISTEAGFEVVPPSTATLRWAPRPELRPRVESSLRYRFTMGEQPAESVTTAPKLTLSLSMTANAPPIGLSYDVYAREDNRQWYIGSFVAAPETTSYRTLQGQVDGLPTNTSMVDVVLIPAEAPALSSPDVEEAWGQGMIIKDVPVTTRPSR